MQRFRNKAAVVAMVLALLVQAGCGDGTGPDEGESQDFSGNYTLHSISQGTVDNVIELPGATGTFTMTATNYTVSINIPIGPVTIDDHGTYTAIGTATAGDFTQQSTDDPSLQYQGTYAWNATTNRLTLDTTSQGIRTVLVLQRT
jgi:hypothetical protein